MAVPKKDSDLVNYSTNFNTLGVAHPTDFGLTAAQMTAYTPLHTAWINAYTACNVEGGKNPSLVAAKNSAKAALLPYARQLYAVVQSSLTVTDANKRLIGVTIRKTTPTPTPPPADSPKLSILSVVGRTVRCQVEDRAFPGTKRKPGNALGVTILSFAGATPPAAGDPNWKLEGQTGKTIFDVQFANDITPGTPCWVTALWYNRRGAYSPACEPLQTYLQIGPVAEETQPMMKAA